MVSLIAQARAGLAVGAAAAGGWVAAAAGAAGAAVACGAQAARIVPPAAIARPFNMSRREILLLIDSSPQNYINGSKWIIFLPLSPRMTICKVYHLLIENF